MTPDHAYWAAQCAAFSDAYLIRFLLATERVQHRYAAAQQAAAAEARRRNLVKEKAPVAGGQSILGRKRD